VDGAHGDVQHTGTCSTRGRAAHGDVPHTGTCRTRGRAAHGDVPHTGTCQARCVRTCARVPPKLLPRLRALALLGARGVGGSGGMRPWTPRFMGAEGRGRVLEGGGGGVRRGSAQ
jgi:hypothetical protein